MTHLWRSTLDPALYPAPGDIQPEISVVSWPAIWAGTITAIGISLALLAIGAGFGLAAVSPWPGVGPITKVFSAGAAVWLIVMQWLSSAAGGYIAGRMRTRWYSLHGDEAFFRDTAQGLVTWALATIVVAGGAVTMSALAGYMAPAAEDPNVSAAMAEEARKVAATIALFTGISMLLGAFIASVSAVIGGRLRDRHP